MIDTRFMDVLWQNVQGFNPADAAVGPAAFDDHLCSCFGLFKVHLSLIHLSPCLSDYSFGGVADPNPKAYLTSICSMCLALSRSRLRALIPSGNCTDLPRVKNDTDLGNVPMVFGEWGITTNFNAVGLN
jgi:glucan endo-1,6-beta-glucosidase